MVKGKTLAAEKFASQLSTIWVSLRVQVTSSTPVLLILDPQELVGMLEVDLLVVRVVCRVVRAMLLAALVSRSSTLLALMSSIESCKPRDSLASSEGESCWHMKMNCLQVLNDVYVRLVTCEHDSCKNNVPSTLPLSLCAASSTSLAESFSSIPQIRAAKDLMFLCGHPLWISWWPLCYNPECWFFLGLWAHWVLHHQLLSSRRPACLWCFIIEDFFDLSESLSTTSISLTVVDEWIQ